MRLGPNSILCNSLCNSNAQTITSLLFKRSTMALTTLPGDLCSGSYARSKFWTSMPGCTIRACSMLQRCCKRSTCTFDIEVDNYIHIRRCLTHYPAAEYDRAALLSVLLWPAEHVPTGAPCALAYACCFLKRLTVGQAPPPPPHEVCYAPSGVRTYESATS